jgi:hypothetical protein
MSKVELKELEEVDVYINNKKPRRFVVTDSFMDQIQLSVKEMRGKKNEVYSIIIKKHE